MCLYPCYIDGTKTVAEGRRIPKEKACVKQPWAKDIVEALKELMLSQAFEVHLFLWFFFPILELLLRGIASRSELLRY